MDTNNKTQKTKIDVEALRKGGVVKLKDPDMYSVWIKTACCNLNSEQLIKIADITDKYARGYLLFSTRQIPIIPHIHLNDVEQVKEELSRVYLELDRCGPRVRNINVCYSNTICPDAITDSISLAEKLENYFRDPILHKIKIGVAGCKKDCIISRVLNDISFVGVEQDGRQGYYDVYVGGKLGLNPFVGVKMASRISEEEAVRFVNNYFELMRNEGKKGERGSHLIKRLGVEYVKQVLNTDLQQRPPVEPVPCATKTNEVATNKMILKIRATCGEITSNQLREIADISEKYGHGFVHFAVRGAPEIPYVDTQYLEIIRERLAIVGLQILDRGIDNLQSCFGEYCTESNAHTQPLLRKVERLVEDLGLNNLNIKISGSGCPNSCGISHINDIGYIGVAKPAVNESECVGCELCLDVCKREAIDMVADIAVINEDKCRHCGQCIAVCPFEAILEEQKGFSILVGGKEGEDTRLGEVIAEFLTDEETLEVTERCLRIVKDRGVNVATLLDEIGIEGLKEMILPSEQFVYCD
ncbi:MAG: 4Fe-4S dicluster domain-containing protein [FCB group bacterium]|nr:4Fe-4S dicluster domain-containing protein [FCB group bacterium]